MSRGVCQDCGHATNFGRDRCPKCERGLKRGKCTNCGAATNFRRELCSRCSKLGRFAHLPRPRPTLRSRPRPTPSGLAAAREYLEEDLAHFREVRDGVLTEPAARITAIYYIDVLLNVRTRLGVA